MNIRDLKYLIALDKHLHFGKAAESCHVSQPTLSMQIKKLEQLLGATLVERSNKLVMLTDFGRQVATHARAILNQVQDIKTLAKMAQNPFAGKIVIGIIPTLSPYFLPKVISKIVKNFPKLKCYLVEEKTAALLSQLTEGFIDAAIIATPIPLEYSLSTTPLFIEEFMLALPKQHHWIKRKSIKKTELSGERFLLLEEGHCLRDQALEICTQLKNGREEFRATSLETLRHMVAAGLGITVIPQLACDNNSQIKYLPFDKPKPIRNISLAWRNTTSKAQLLIALADLIKTSF